MINPKPIFRQIFVKGISAHLISALAITSSTLISTAHGKQICPGFFSRLRQRVTKTESTTPAIESQREIPDLSSFGLKPLSTQGRNGFWFIDSHGDRWFVKPDTEFAELQTSAEIITSAIYRELGYKAAETRLLVANGNRYTASREIKGEPISLDGLKDSKAIRKLRIFAAYLKDWDRLIPSNNIKTPEGQIGLLDFGGSLGAKATGGHKPGPVQSPAIGSFRHDDDLLGIFFDFAPQGLISERHATHPFNQLTRSDAEEALRDLERLDLRKITKIVDSAHYSSPSDRNYMIDALLRRKETLRSRLLSQFPSESPTADEIGNRLFAVHATHLFPKDGVLRAGSIDYSKGTARPYMNRNTVHFSLGELVRSHRAGNWETRDYAIITPLKNISDQLINLHPYDSFTVGNVTIPKGSVVLAPRKNEGKLPVIPGITYRYYEGPIRTAIEREIDSLGGWHVRMNGGSGPAIIGGTDRATPDFFKNYLARHPSLSFGTSTKSLRGEAGRLGTLEYNATFLGRYFDSQMLDAHPPTDTSKLKILRAFYKFQIAKLDRYFHADNQASNVKLEWQKRLKEYQGLVSLMDVDLEFRAATGRTLQDAPQVILDELIALRSNPAALRSWLTQQISVAKKLKNRIPFTQKPFRSAPNDPGAGLAQLTDLAEDLSTEDAKEFIHLNWKFRSQEEANQFWEKRAARELREKQN